MTFSVLIRATKDYRVGSWFDLPSQAALVKWQELEDSGKSPFIEQIVSDFPYLKQYNLHELNSIAQGLEELPVNIRKELPQLLDYEDLEEIIRSRGRHFIFHDESSLKTLAKELFEEGVIPEDVVKHYIDFSALGRSLPDVLDFFKARNGGYYQFVG